MIEQFMAGTEDEVCSMVANLLRRHIRTSWEKSVGGVEKSYQSTQKDMVQKYACLQDTIEIGDVVDDQDESRLKLTEWMQRASHVVPIGLVQFSDFISDIIVVIQLYKLGGPEWIIAVSAMGLSMIMAWLWILFYENKWKDRLKLCLLAPLNLHTLYYGLSE